MRSAEEIMALWHERKMAQSPMLARMEEIRNANNGDLVLPLPEIDKIEKAAVANLIQQGIDQLGARIASVRPDVDCPSTFPGQDLADKRARQRRLAILGWWDHSEMEILDGRRARHLLAYASSPVELRPSHNHPIPTWHVRSPLATFAAPRPNPDDMRPDDCIFTYSVTLGFLRHRYPDVVGGLEIGTATPDEKFEVLEYLDDDVRVMIAVGRSPAQSGGPGWGQASRTVGAPHAELLRVPNRIGKCPVVIPKRTSLDFPIGKFDGMIGMYQGQAKLMALVLNAVKQNVFPKEWLVARPGEQPQILAEADPTSGRTGVVAGGVLEPQTLNPSSMAIQMVELLEGNQRQQGGLPAEFGGVSPTNVRTGRRGDSVISAQVDFPIQEAQTILARSKEHENCIGVLMSKAYWPDKTVSFYVRKMKGASKEVSYVPTEIFTTDVNFVDYPHAGSDANQLAVLIGQLVGLQLISEETARRLHPLVDDPDHEADMVVAEALDKALLASIAMQVQQGTLGVPDVANIITAMKEDRSTLAQAVIKVHQAEQARQAGQPQTAPGPGVAGAPGGPPGLAPGPGGAPGGAAAPPSVAPPSPSVDNLAQLLSTLHTPPQQMAAAS